METSLGCTSIDVGWALLVAVDAKNVALEGEGAIDGQGSALKERHIKVDTRPEGQRWGLRPFLLRWVRCEGVRVEGVTLKYAGAWTSHYFQCRNVNIHNVTIRSFGVAHNDGINIDGCQHVRISNCDIVSGDDALCFKTTASKMGCDDIIVTDMKLKSNQAGIKMGTESMAGFENIKISNCHIYDTKNGGIKLFSVDGAHLRNVEISDITMDEVRTPMLFRLGARLSVFRKQEDTQQPIGVFENVIIRNVKAVAADKAQLTPPSGILITGIPGHYITNLTLENIHIRLLGTGTPEDALSQVPEAIDKYPEVKTFGPKIPAYGVWARHVKGLKLKNVTFELKNPDARPDNRFATHNGFDFEEIKKAMKENETRKRKRGASTISQQTAKNVFLWPQSSWVRKGFEVYFTWLIELCWSKERIMEVYLNSIEMGQGIYGAEAAAKYKFHTTAAKLTAGQCALIAATLPNPIRFDSAHPSAYILRRQSQILRLMKLVPKFPPVEKKEVKKQKTEKRKKK